MDKLRLLTAAELVMSTSQERFGSPTPQGTEPKSRRLNDAERKAIKRKKAKRKRAQKSRRRNR